MTLVSGEHQIYLLKGNNAITTMSSLIADSTIEHIEPNYIYYATGLDWGLQNSGQPDCGGVSGTPGIDIKALGAWTKTRGTSDIVVAVTDTGVQYDHAEFKGHIAINEKEANGVANVDDDGNGYVDDIYGYDFVGNTESWDLHSHGTFVPA